MSSMMYYTIMPDGTVKQLNPFTGTEVWAVAGRRSKPIANDASRLPRPWKSIPPRITAASAPRATMKRHRKNRV